MLPSKVFCHLMCSWSFHWYLITFVWWLISVPPDILDYPTSSDMVVREGSNVTLKCAATGSPKPTIVWRREDGDMIPVSGGQEGNSPCKSFPSRRWCTLTRAFTRKLCPYTLYTYIWQLFSWFYWSRVHVRKRLTYFRLPFSLYINSHPSLCFRESISSRQNVINRTVFIRQGEFMYSADC